MRTYDLISKVFCGGKKDPVIIVRLCIHHLSDGAEAWKSFEYDGHNSEHYKYTSESTVIFFEALKKNVVEITSYMEVE